MNKNLLIVVFLAIAVIAGWYWWSSLPPPGVESRGPAEIKDWVSLAVAVLSFLTALITLWGKLREKRA